MKIDIDIQEKYEQLTVSIGNRRLDEEVQQVLKRLEAPEDRRLACKDEDDIHLVRPEEVILCCSENKKVILKTVKGSYISQDRLYELEEKLSAGGFVRLSKFAIANMAKIKKLEVTFNGSLVAHMQGGHSEIISRRQLTTVKQRLGLK